MKKLHFEIDINAPREAVWRAIVEDAEYRKWASTFHEGSFFEGGWNKDDAIRFITLNEKGEKGGMVAEIAESRKPEYISIRHIGFMQAGVEDTTSETIKAWAPAYENYTFEEKGETTTKFIVDMDTADDWYDDLNEMWPRALKKLKDVAENLANSQRP